MLVFKIATRNIMRNKRRSILNGVAMCICFILVSISIGMTEGGYARIIEIFTNENIGHVQIHNKDYVESPSIYKAISSFQEIYRMLDNIDKVKNYSPRLYSGALAFAKNKSIGISLVGIDAKREKDNTSMLKKIVKGGDLVVGNRQVYVSENISKSLNVNVDDEIVLISQGADGSVANDIFIIAGIMNTEGSTMGNNLIVMPIDDMWNYLSLWGRIHEIVVSLDDYNTSEKVAEEISRNIEADYIARPWFEVKADFYKAMKADKQGGYVFLFIIMIVASIGVLNTVLMSVFERMREYGLLKSIGTTPAQIFNLIVLENGLLTIMSILPGLIGAWAANEWLSVHGFVMDPPIEYGGIVFESIKSVVNVQIFLVPAIIVGVTSLVVSIFPAIIAARVVPNKVMRIIG